MSTEQVKLARYAAQRELIVLARTDVLFGAAAPPAPSPNSLTRTLDENSIGNPVIGTILRKYDARIRPLFAAKTFHPPQDTALPGIGLNIAPTAYHRIAADDAVLEALADDMRTVQGVAAAYIKPAAEPPVNRMYPTAAPPEPAVGTPDFSTRQNYLDAAPGGVDARYSWTQAGGRGAGIKIVDIEGEWQLEHEDLQANSSGLISGTPPGDPAWRNHGTAVLGILNGSDNGLGITSVCPDAKVGVASIFGDNRTSSAAIRDAADQLQAGDVLLVELHRPGPSLGFQPDNQQRGYIAVEWWPDDFEAIQYATGRGIVVVEAAGNGAEDLDAAIYDTGAQGFPAGWVNPFKRGNHDSGAVLVGAGAPPPGTHGRTLYGPDRSRLDFSNYGTSIDVQGWGREVTTSGYGDLQGGLNENVWYTDQFAGTSSASPIVVGVLACLQGTVRANGQPPLTSLQIRELLRTTGSPQQDGPEYPASQRIGNRPDLRALIAAPRPIS
ncbi:S8 family peptidase [Mesorhizobium sp. M0006]|uniref:S8 family peptidase n=1 Tax=Mesorhizobium sp. M0006 TaxID=2956838 RepID=UPI00333D5E9B